VVGISRGRREAPSADTIRVFHEPRSNPAHTDRAPFRFTSVESLIAALSPFFTLRSHEVGKYCPGESNPLREHSRPTARFASLDQ
jgi:hypothetical protein